MPAPPEPPTIHRLPGVLNTDHPRDGRRRHLLNARETHGRREVSLGQEVHHQLVEVVWSFQWQHV